MGCQESSEICSAVSLALKELPSEEQTCLFVCGVENLRGSLAGHSLLVFPSCLLVLVRTANRPVPFEQVLSLFICARACLFFRAKTEEIDIVN